MKSKIFLITLSLIAFFAMSVSAQNCPVKQHPQGKKGANPEMKAYVEQNILPVMKIQRQELDKQISDTDKARLEEIRAELKSMQTIMREKRMAMRESDEKPTLEQRKEMREHRSKMNGLMEEVEIMSENYDAPISVALESIRENEETWKNEMRELCPNPNPGMGECPQGNRNKQGNGNKQGKGNKQGNQRGNQPEHRKGPQDGMPFQRLLSPEGFLLWNYNEPMPSFDENNDPGAGTEVNVFPNPTAESVQVSVMLESDQSIEINMMDRDGQVVLSIPAEKVSEGLFTKTIDVSSLEKGIYFVKMNVNGESIVRRVIVQ